jgi:hypothetical protein
MGFLGAFSDSAFGGSSILLWNGLWPVDRQLGVKKVKKSQKIVKKGIKGHSHTGTQSHRGWSPPAAGVKSMKKTEINVEKHGF